MTDELTDEELSALCSHCAGEGCEEGCGRQGRGWCQSANDGPDSHQVCAWCNGSALEDTHE